MVAGQIDWFGLIGTRAENVAEQVRNLDQFLILLNNQGVIVDAYVDLTDGSIKGTVTERARFLIMGKPPYISKSGFKPEKVDLAMKASASAQAALGAGDTPTAAKEFKKAVDASSPRRSTTPRRPPRKGSSTAQERLRKLPGSAIEDVNAGILELRKQCVDKGMFIISAENYAHVVGIQRFRASNGPEEVGFRPRQPFAGNSQ